MKFRRRRLPPGVPATRQQVHSMYAAMRAPRPTGDAEPAPLDDDPAGDQRRGRTAADRSTWAKRYHDDGETLAQIPAADGVSPSTVRAHLDEIRMPRRAPGRPPPGAQPAPAPPRQVLHPVQLPSRHGTIGLVPAELTEAAFAVHAALDPGETLDALNQRGGLPIERLLACLYAARYPTAQWRQRVEQVIELFDRSGFRP